VVWLRLMKRSDKQDSARELVINSDDILRVEQKPDGKVAVYFREKMKTSDGSFQSHTFVDDAFDAIARALSAIKPQP